jgi:hypothetical protein
VVNNRRVSDGRRKMNMGGLDMLSVRWFAVFILGLAISCGDLSAAVTGQWNFDNSGNPLAADIGDPIEYYDGVGGDTEAATVFGLTSDLGIPNIGGTPAAVMGFPQTDLLMGYKLFHGVPSNGGGFFANQYTVIMDIMFPASSSGVWRALFQTDTFNSDNDDAEFYLDGSNGVGINGVYNGNVPADTWVRMAIAVDLTKETEQITKYINGVKVGTNGGELDSRFAMNGTDLAPDDCVLLFTDGYAGGPYSAPGYVSSIQTRDVCLTDVEVAALGGPSASGIPTSSEAQAVITAFTPQDGAVGYWPDARVAIIVEDVGAALQPASVQLLIDDQAVTPSVEKIGAITTVTYAEDTVLAPGSEHTVQFSFTDSLGTDVQETRSFTVANYTNIQLSEPLYFEDFEGVAETALPAGWTAWNYSDEFGWDPGNTDPQDIGSAVYADWTVIDSSRFTQPMVTYDQGALTDDYQRVLTPNPSNVVNGMPVDELASGKILFGNAGYRNGDVVIYITSPSYDLSGATNVYLSFHSIYEQNQDNIGALEYSVDGGTSWLPVVYMIDEEEIVLDGEGNVDAVATLTAENDDQAVSVDPDLGPAHADFLGAPITQALAPFISGRVDDDARESKRVELFRLSAADEQANVQFRFLLTGTDSWYWGIDNFGLYSLIQTPPPVIDTAPASATRHVGTPVSFTVVASGEGELTYQWLFEGSEIPGETGTELVVDSISMADAGAYTVAVSNSGGTTVSPAAVLTVLPAIDTVFGMWNFDQGDLTPASGACVLQYADAATSGLVSFETTGGAVPGIGGEAAEFLRVPAFTDAANGLNWTFVGAGGNGGGEYINQYTMIFDVLIPGDLNWTPFFNTLPSNGNDADWYVDDAGAIGIGALGYSAAGAFTVDQWHRVAFVADLGLGVVRYYVDGVEVFQRTGGSMLEGRFSLYNDQHEGPDVRLFNEPSGSYTHELLVSSIFFINETLTPQEVMGLGGPTAAGIEYVPAGDAPELMIGMENGKVVLTWDGPGRLEQADTPSGPWEELIGATSPVQFDPVAGVKFFQVVTP